MVAWVSGILLERCPLGGSWPYPAQCFPIKRFQFRSLFACAVGNAQCTLYTSCADCVYVHRLSTIFVAHSFCQSDFEESHNVTKSHFCFSRTEAEANPCTNVFSVDCIAVFTFLSSCFSLYFYLFVPNCNII